MLGIYSQLVYHISSVYFMLDSRYIIHYDMPKSFEGALVMPTILCDDLTWPRLLPRDRFDFQRYFVDLLTC